MIPGRKALRTDLGNEIHPNAIAGAHAEPGAVQADALLLFHDPLIGFDALEPAFLAELETRSLTRGGPFLDLPFDKRVAVCVDGLQRRPTRASRCGRPPPRSPFAAFLVVGDSEERHDRHRIRPAGDGPPRHCSEGIRRVLLREEALAASAPRTGACRRAV